MARLEAASSAAILRVLLRIGTSYVGSERGGPVVQICLGQIGSDPCRPIETLVGRLGGDWAPKKPAICDFLCRYLHGFWRGASTKARGSPLEQRPTRARRLGLAGALFEVAAARTPACAWSVSAGRGGSGHSRSPRARHGKNEPLLGKGAVRGVRPRGRQARDTGRRASDAEGETRGYTGTSWWWNRRHIDRRRHRDRRDRRDDPLELLARADHHLGRTRLPSAVSHEGSGT